MRETLLLFCSTFKWFKEERLRTSELRKSICSKRRLSVLRILKSTFFAINDTIFKLSNELTVRFQKMLFVIKTVKLLIEFILKNLNLLKLKVKPEKLFNNKPSASSFYSVRELYLALPLK